MDYNLCKFDLWASIMGNTIVGRRHLFKLGKTRRRDKLIIEHLLGLNGGGITDFAKTGEKFDIHPIRIEKIVGREFVKVYKEIEKSNGQVFKKIRFLVP